MCRTVYYKMTSHRSNHLFWSLIQILPDRFHAVPARKLLRWYLFPVMHSVQKLHNVSGLRYRHSWSCRLPDHLPYWITGMDLHPSGLSFSGTAAVSEYQAVHSTSYIRRLPGFHFRQLLRTSLPWSHPRSLQASAPAADLWYPADTEDRQVRRTSWSSARPVLAHLSDIRHFLPYHRFRFHQGRCIFLPLSSFSEGHSLSYWWSPDLWSAVPGLLHRHPGNGSRHFVLPHTPALRFRLH